MTPPVKGVYEVYVTNLGCVESGGRDRCKNAFREYVKQSRNNIGRAGGQHVTMFKDGEVIKECVGTMGAIA